MVCGLLCQTCHAKEAAGQAGEEVEAVVQMESSGATGPGYGLVYLPSLFTEKHQEAMPVVDCLVIDDL
jgi:hypothetical protein